MSCGIEDIDALATPVSMYSVRLLQAHAFCLQAHAACVQAHALVGLENQMQSVYSPVISTNC